MDNFRTNADPWLTDTDAPAHPVLQISWRVLRACLLFPFFMARGAWRWYVQFLFLFMMRWVGAADAGDDEDQPYESLIIEPLEIRNEKRMAGWGQLFDPPYDSPYYDYHNNE